MTTAAEYDAKKAELEKEITHLQNERDDWLRIIGKVESRLAALGPRPAEPEMASIEQWLRQGLDTGGADRWICAPKGPHGPLVARSYLADDIAADTLHALGATLRSQRKDEGAPDVQRQQQRETVPSLAPYTLNLTTPVAAGDTPTPTPDLET